MLVYSLKMSNLAQENPNNNQNINFKTQNKWKSSSLKSRLAAITADIDKVDNKAAKARVRKATLALEKAAKEYRKVSVK